MSKKNAAGREEGESSSQPICSLPASLRLANLSNSQQPNQIISLRLRIDELENKVGQLEARIKAKRKRIRRKASEVDKKHKVRPSHSVPILQEALRVARLAQPAPAHQAQAGETRGGQSQAAGRLPRQAHLNDTIMQCTLASTSLPNHFGSTADPHPPPRKRTRSPSICLPILPNKIKFIDVIDMPSHDHAWPISRSHRPLPHPQGCRCCHR